MKVHNVVSLLLLLSSATTCCSSQRVRRAFAHYLPWYDSEGLQFPYRTGWCLPDGNTYDCSDQSVVHYSNTPLIGEYSQFDDDVLEYHLLTAFVTGIDGFIVNINPSNAMQKSAALAVLDRIVSLTASLSSFTFKVMVSYDDNGETDQSKIQTYLSWIFNNIYDNPAYSSIIFHDDVTSFPVLLAWSESDPAYYYSTVKNMFSDSVFFMTRNALRFEYGDANFEWVNYLNTGLPKTNTANWGQQYFDDFDYIMARQSSSGTAASDLNLVKMGGVYPGFDDENVPPSWNGGVNRYHLRNVDDGETMSLTWQKQINYSPLRLGGTDSVENPWVQIATWNDWPEGTSIEPATEDTYGYTAVETNRVKIAEFKNGSPAFAENCLRVPFEIFQLRKANQKTEADMNAANLVRGACTTVSATNTPSSSPLEENTSSATASVTPSSSPSTRPSISASSSVTPSASPSTSPTPSSSPSVTPSVTPSPSPRPCLCSCRFLQESSRYEAFLRQCEATLSSLPRVLSAPGVAEEVFCNEIVEKLCYAYT